MIKIGGTIKSTIDKYSTIRNALYFSTNLTKYSYIKPRNWEKKQESIPKK